MANSKKIEGEFTPTPEEVEKKKDKTLMYYGANDACVVLMGIFRVVEVNEGITREMRNLLDGAVMSLRNLKDAFQRKMTGSRETMDPQKLIGVAETLKKLARDENFLAAVEAESAKEGQRKRPNLPAEENIIENKQDMVQLLEKVVNVFNQCALDNYSPDSKKH